MISRKRLGLASAAGQPVSLIKLRHLCSWIREANNKDITKCALSDFPKYIYLEYSILPTDITNLFYVIRAASEQVFTLEVKYCKFIGDGDTLSRFWKEVANSKTKIRSFDLDGQLISDDDSSFIVGSLQHVQKLSLLNCEVPTSLVAALSEKWEEIGTNIEHLNLSGNQIGDEGLWSLARLPRFRSLSLESCDISSKDCAEFAEKMVKTEHKVEDLNLSHNKIGDEGFWSLARLPGIRRLELWNCDISSKGCAKFAEKMIKTKLKVEDLNLSHNKIGDEGFSFLACLPGIRRLELYGCDISSKGCTEFAEKMNKTKLKLEVLGLSYNDRIDYSGVQSLLSCHVLIEKLWLWRCGFTEAVKEEIRSELRRLNLPEDRVVF